MVSLIELGWLISTILALAIATYFDVKTRIIPDEIWLFQLLCGIIINIFWFLASPSFMEIIVFALGIAVSTIVAIVIILTGAMGVADAKGIFCVGISFPFFVELISPVFEYNPLIPAFFSIIFYFLILNILLSLVIFLTNMYYQIGGRQLYSDLDATPLTKVLILFEGVQVTLDQVKTWKHYDVVERYDGENWKLDVPRFEQELTDDEYEELERELREETIANMELTGRKLVWVRWQPPGILFFLISIILLEIFGPIFSVLFQS